ncbi:MAG: TIGR02444 family protein [Xanthobacteraceae bacterium]
MNDTETKTRTTPFWRFSLHFYRQPGVSDACIALQDDCGVDVNVLLFLLWLADDGQLVSVDEVRKLDDQVHGWRNLTVIPIREVRRKLKGARTLVDPGKQEVFRNKVKAVELEAERLQQEALYAFAQSGPLGEQAAPSAAARGNASAYERVMNVTYPRIALDVLLGAFDSLEHGCVAAAIAAARE